MWPDILPSSAASPEQVLLFESAGGRPLTLASNCPYEVWLDGRFAGDGGHRCAPGEALPADAWPEAASARAIRVRLHWIDPSQTEVFFRCLFDDPFFAELPPAGSWSCSLDETVRPAAKVCRQLPRQTVTLPPRPNVPRCRCGPTWSSRPLEVLAPPITGMAVCRRQTWLCRLVASTGRAIRAVPSRGGRERRRIRPRRPAVRAAV